MRYQEFILIVFPLFFCWATAFHHVNGTKEDAIKTCNYNLGEGAIVTHRVSLGDEKTFDVILLDVETTGIQFYHKDKAGAKIGSVNSLKKILARKNENLLFATNGGMFKSNLSPTGLYVENGETLYPLNTKKSEGSFSNFYDLQPNGVFYILDNNKFGIIPKEKYGAFKNVKFATQSGPMIIIDGKVNNFFNKASKSKFIRSGVGVTQRGKLMFAISNTPVTFYDFHRIFKYYACQNALYLDGAVSEMYLDIKDCKRLETQNDFSSIIAISEKK